ncbi:MAG: dihydrodipicolinate synthase family protein [Spirochaetota bacterium]|nr:dihydrodipicolinate synthase family protein [Spirochaetota bacterium]
MTKHFSSHISSGIWPTMITPFSANGTIDYEGLEYLIEWYIREQVSGLFAVCQSSEMFFLTREERRQLAEAVVRFVDGRIPVIASGHISESIDEQIRDITEIGSTGVNAVVLVSNRLLPQGEKEALWYSNIDYILKHIPENIQLGIYECPYPYKHVLTKKMLYYLDQSERFTFLKDTISVPASIKYRASLELSNLKLFNANSATLLSSLRLGYAGFSGIMANFHPRLYHWLWVNHSKKLEKLKHLQHFLSLASMIEAYGYPLNAKVYLNMFEGLPIYPTQRANESKKLPHSVSPLLAQLKKQSDYWLEKISGG